MPADTFFPSILPPDPRDDKPLPHDSRENASPAPCAADGSTTPFDAESGAETAALQEKIRTLEAKMDRLNQQLDRWSGEAPALAVTPVADPRQPAWLTPLLAGATLVLVAALTYALLWELPERERVARNDAVRETQRGGLIIDSSPPGAMVTVGGEAAAPAPAHLSNLRTGTQKVVISAEGYEPLTLKTDIRAGEFTDMGRVILKPAVATLKLTSPLTAATYEVEARPAKDGRASAPPLDNKPAGGLPASLSLPLGAYRVTFRCKGFPDKYFDIELIRGETRELTWATDFSTLAVDSTPAEVELSLNGTAMGPAPLLAQVPAGPQKIVAKRTGWPDQTREVTLEPGRRADITFDFKPARYDLTSEPAGASIRKKSPQGVAGQPLGTTPHTVELPPSDTEFELTLPGYLPATIKASPGSGETVKLAATLRKVPDTMPKIGENFTLASTSASSNRLAESSEVNDEPSENAPAKSTQMPALEMVWLPGLQIWVGRYEVTQAEYERVAGVNPSTFRHPRNPVENVSWTDAVAFCERLTQLSKEAGTLPRGYVYRLPSDAEYSLYVGDASLDVSVTSRDFRRKGPEEVGSRAPNEFGLYDVRGNVWEWADDWYDSIITKQEPHPSNPHGGRKFRVLRGASWEDRTTENLDVRARAYAEPGTVNDRAGRRYGFRVVLAPPLPAPASADTRAEPPAETTVEKQPAAPTRDSAGSGTPAPVSPESTSVPPTSSDKATSTNQPAATKRLATTTAATPTTVKSASDFEIRPLSDVDTVPDLRSPDMTPPPRDYQPSAP
ncbi:hypothetical protein DB346_05160 [Verrucomicrobia bacterium LW23]|nr:hypothetical protein DB346_05160 [Verrucomicrobia bacterium LW23]